MIRLRCGYRLWQVTQSRDSGMVLHGKTPWEREQGRKWTRDSMEYGERFFMKKAKERGRPTGVEAPEIDVEAQPGAQSRQSRERAKVGKLAQRDQCRQDREKGALHPRGAKERKIRFEELAASPESGHELKDEF